MAAAICSTCDAMNNALIINRSPSEVRVALLENGMPVEVYVEREQHRGVVGNIYRGHVARVLPGMQAAFIELGLERTGFLYVNDALERPATPLPPDADADANADGEAPEVPANHGGAAAARFGGNRGFRPPPAANIADLLKEGQDIIVQVLKEPIGTKGARLSRHVTLPGRYAVYMPFSEHVGISQRIADETERERLRVAASSVARPEGTGFILRTAAEGIPDDRIQAEATMLIKMWEKIAKEGKKGPSPRLLFSDLDIVLRAVRDLFTDDVEQIVCDSEDDHKRVAAFVRTFGGRRDSCVQLHDGQEPIFDHYGIELEIQRALDRKVWLKSGGHIIIDQAEALTVIDINSGRYVGKTSLEETVTQINLEAVKEIAYQLRLRNIGGIIIIDFIDMSHADNRNKVLGFLVEALKRDKAKTTVVSMSEIGLVEMTRKRVRESLGRVLTDACPYCKGRGAIKSETTIAAEILRAVEKTLARKSAATVLVNMSANVADYLYANEPACIEALEQRFKTRIVPVARDGFHQEQYEVVLGSS